ncbi:hypothetical protein J6590_096988 [Homalodisca vitripennis]|nr:hypothetical protein J6590_096988 [Homalodisca vitripennis]
MQEDEEGERLEGFVKRVSALAVNLTTDTLLMSCRTFVLPGRHDKTASRMRLTNIALSYLFNYFFMGLSGKGDTRT